MDKKKELNEQDLQKVSGGLMEESNDDVLRDWGYFHTGCGGRLMNVGEAFSRVYCKKCGENHFFSKEFARENTLETLTGYRFIIFYKGSISYDDIKNEQPRPDYLDWSINQ